MSGHGERDIHREIAGRELVILQALGIEPQRTSHQHCWFPDHEDRNPSWRWDGSKARWFCSCGSGSVVDAVMRVQGLEVREAIRWIRELLDGQAPRHRSVRTAPPPANDNAEQEKRRLQEQVAARALEGWEKAGPASPDHPYLIDKRVGPHELRELSGMLLVPLFDIDGRLWNLQTIRQDDEGKFRKLFLKHGRAKGLFSPIGLTEPPQRLVISEGWSTGATLHEETGSSVMCAMSANNLLAVARAAREAWPDAAIIVAADDDRSMRNNPGLTQATLAAIAVGARLAVPEFPEDAKPKDSDFNDLHWLKPGAVKAAIDAAKMPEPQTAPGAPIATLSAAEAAERCDAAIAEAFQDGLAWKPAKMWKGMRLTADGRIDLGSVDDASTAPVFGVKATLGLGKTETMLRWLADPALADRHINVYAPAHRLNGELQKRAEAKAVPGSPYVRVVRGRQQKMPDETPMCRKAQLASDIEQLGLKVQEHLCEKKPKKGGEPERCEFFDACLYQQQLRDKAPGVRLYAHAHTIVDHHKADTFNVIDESFWQSALRGADKPYYLPFAWLEAFRSVPMVGRGMHVQFAAQDDAGTAELMDISLQCLKAIRASGRLADFAAEGITSSDCKHAAGLEYRRIEALAVTPGMKEPIQRERVNNYAAQSAFKLARFFTLAGEALEAGVEPALSCFDLRLNCPNGENPPEDRIYMLWRRELKLGDVPTLLIDADLAPEIARQFFPQLGEITTIDARMSNYHAVQVVDRSFSKASLCTDQSSAGRRAKLRRLLEVKAAEGKKVLLVSYKEAEEAIQALGKPIEGIEYAHWNDLRGRDQWADVDVLVIVGTPQPGEREIERMARALWYKDKDTIKTLPEDSKYHSTLRGITMTNGSVVPSYVRVHPDQRCTLILDQIRNETMQAIGRARLVHRAADKPCEVILCTPYPTQLPIHEIKPWNDVVPDLLTLLVSRGIVSTAWRDTEALLSDVIESEGGEPGHAAREAFRRAGLPSPADLVAGRIPHDPLWRLYYRSSCGIRWFRYRVKGRRKGAEVLVDLNRHPDAKAALERAFGELDRFEALDVGTVGRAVGEADMTAPTAPPEPAHPPPPMPAAEPMSAVKPEPLQVSEPPLVVVAEAKPDASPSPELVASAFIGFRHEDPDFDEWHGWPGPDPDELRRQAALPRLVVANMPAAPPEAAGELSDAELIRLLPPKRPTDTACGWEMRAHDVLRAWRVEWFRAQRLVAAQSRAHDWRPVRDASAVSIRGSP